MEEKEAILGSESMRISWNSIGMKGLKAKNRGVLCNILIVSIFSWQIEDNSARQTLSMLDLQGARFSEPLQQLGNVDFIVDLSGFRSTFASFWPFSPIFQSFSDVFGGSNCPSRWPSRCFSGANL